MNEDIINSVWMEKYRPNSIASMVLPIRLKNYFNKIIKTGNVPNMILHSVRAGTGKTTSAKALCQDLNADFYYINTSLNRGIDVLRDDIQQYATTLSPMNTGVKICIMDEFDYTTIDLQKAMRAAIEEFTETCRFIFACNSLNRIIPQIQSRCEMVDFNFMDEKIKQDMIPKIYVRLCNILKAEKIQYNEDTLKKMAMVYYPDIRHMIKLTQQYSTMYGLISDDIFRFREIEEELALLIMSKKVTQARKFIMDKGYDYDTLYRFLFDNIVPKIESKDSRALAILTIDDYMRGSATSIDKEITFSACMVKLCEAL